MLFKALVQIVLAISLVEMVPIDGTELERQAGLPRAADRVPSIERTVELAFNTNTLSSSEALSPPVKVDQDSFGIVTTAVSALVYDSVSGTVLYEKNPSEVRSIGSITKLMTAYVVNQSGIDFNSEATVTEADVRYGGINYLALNDPVTVGEILKTSLVGSDNSATIALVRLTGWNQELFVAKMNEAAAELGMSSTMFTDPTGLSSYNRSTAEDIVKLLQATLAIDSIKQATTESEAIFSSASGREYTIPNTNELLVSYLNAEPYNIEGGKTGYLPEAGYCLAMEVQELGGHDIFVIALGSQTKGARFQEVKGLAQWAYDTYDWPDQI